MRVDRLLMGAYADAGKGHAIFDTLGAKTNAIHTYRIYSKLDGSETVSVATLLPGSEGHRGIVHGGVTALLLDNSLGWAQAIATLASSGELQSTLAGKPLDDDTTARFGMTAYLNINYRSPCVAGSTLIITCSVERSEGRKRFVNAEARDAGTGALVADSESLFVRPRPKP